MVKCSDLILGTEFTAYFKDKDAWIMARILKINFLPNAVSYTFKVLESYSPAFKDGDIHTYKGRVLYDAIESIEKQPEFYHIYVNCFSNEEVKALLKEENECYYRILAKKGYSIRS